MRVLHVSLAMGGGITSSVLAMVEATPDIDHHLLARPRTQHDTGADLAGGFGSVHLVAGNPLATVRALRRRVRETFPDVVHAHSSVAGVLARAAVPDHPCVVYSPHCFAFERRDISALERFAYTAAERSLAGRTDLLVAVAPHELELAAGLGHREVAYVPNRADIAMPATATYRNPMRVVTAGRISRQKDWRYLLHLKRYADAHLDLDLAWTWLGGGSSEDEQTLGAAGIEVTGWIDREQLLAQMADAQIYLHTAAWEGAPISILEAADLGLPLALRSLDSLDSLDLPGRADTIAGLTRRIADLADPGRWRRAQQESWEVAARHSADVQGRHLRDAYARATGRSVVPASGAPAPLPTVARAAETESAPRRTAVPHAAGMR